MPGRRFAVSLVVLAACGRVDHLAPEESSDLEEALQGVTCPEASNPNADVCSGTGRVYTSVERIGATETSAGELAQTFRVTRPGVPGRLRLRLRLLRPLPPGPVPVLVALREVGTSGIPLSPASTLASASWDAQALTAQTSQDAEFVLEVATPSTPPILDPAKTYAFVVSVAPIAGATVLLGVASQSSEDYADGSAWRRGRRLGAGSVLSDPPFARVALDNDLSFSFTLDDGVPTEQKSWWCTAAGPSCETDCETCAGTTNVWFLDAAGGGSGLSVADPTCPDCAEFQPEADDVIVLLDSHGPIASSGGLALLPRQRLIGRGSGGSPRAVTLASGEEIQVVVPGTRPVLTRAGGSGTALVLANDAVVEGIGLSGATAGITSPAQVANPLVRDVVASGLSGRAVHLDQPTGDIRLLDLAITHTPSTNGTEAVFVYSPLGTVTLTGNAISNSNGPAIEVDGNSTRLFDLVVTGNELTANDAVNDLLYEGTGLLVATLTGTATVSGNTVNAFDGWGVRFTGLKGSATVEDNGVTIGQRTGNKLAGGIEVGTSSISTGNRTAIIRDNEVDATNAQGIDTSYLVAQTITGNTVTASLAVTGMDTVSVLSGRDAVVSGNHVTLVTSSGYSSGSEAMVVEAAGGALVVANNVVSQTNGMRGLSVQSKGQGSGTVAVTGNTVTKEVGGLTSSFAQIAVGAGSLGGSYAITSFDVSGNVASCRNEDRCMTVGFDATATRPLTVRGAAVHDNQILMGNFELDRGTYVDLQLDVHHNTIDLTGQAGYFATIPLVAIDGYAASTSDTFPYSIKFRDNVLDAANAANTGISVHGGNGLSTTGAILVAANMVTNVRTVGLFADAGVSRRYDLEVRDNTFSGPMLTDYNDFGLRLDVLGSGGRLCLLVEGNSSSAPSDFGSVSNYAAPDVGQLLIENWASIGGQWWVSSLSPYYGSLASWIASDWNDGIVLTGQTCARVGF